MASLALFKAAFTSLFDIVAAKYKEHIISMLWHKMYTPLLHRGYFKQRNVVQYAKTHTETDEKNDTVKITHI